MAEQTLIQFRADKQLKDEVTAIYESIGMDLPTAFRMFLARSKIEKGLPFPAVMPESVVTRTDALSAFEALREQAADVPEMTDEEVNFEIKAVRDERKGK